MVLSILRWSSAVAPRAPIRSVPTMRRTAAVLPGSTRGQPARTIHKTHRVVILNIYPSRNPIYRPGKDHSEIARHQNGSRRVCPAFRYLFEPIRRPADKSNRINREGQRLRHHKCTASRQSFLQLCRATLRPNAIPDTTDCDNHTGNRQGCDRLRDEVNIRQWCKLFGSL